MIFSKEKFLSSADKSTIRLLSGHTDALDGKRVIFSDDDKYGTSEPYSYAEQDWQLYPVYPEWCKESDI